MSRVTPLQLDLTAYDEMTAIEALLKEVSGAGRV